MTKKTGRGGATPYYYIHARRGRTEGRQGRRGEAEGRGGHCGTAAVYTTGRKGGAAEVPQPTEPEGRGRRGKKAEGGKTKRREGRLKGGRKGRKLFHQDFLHLTVLLPDNVQSPALTRLSQTVNAEPFLLFDATKWNAPDFR